MGRARERLLVCAVLLLAPVVIAAKGRGWAHDRSELPADENVVWGELGNGFRYAIKPHAAKPGAVSMRLLVEVGSLNERESERGLAHFIEHMAFRGTRNFRAGELVAFFQGLGMSYGVDVNAFTYHDKTVYHLELPNNSVELVERSLELYRDYADGILFEEEFVEKERDVILREKKARESPSARIAQESFRFAFAGTRLAERNPIGLESVLHSVTSKELLAFYEKWYRPDLMTLVVVGDVEAEALIAAIGRQFSGLEKPRGQAPNRKIGRLKRLRPARTGSLVLQGVERSTLELSRAWAEKGTEDSWGLRERDTLRAFATALFNERCRLLIDGMSDNFASYDRVYGFPFCQLTISSGGERWWEAFLWMDQLIRQARSYGFTQEEMERLRGNWLQSSRSSADLRESAEPRMLVDELVDSIASDQVYVGPAPLRERMEAFVRSLSLEQVNAAFRDVWDLRRMSYFMAGDFEEPLHARDLKKLLKEDRRLVMLPFIPNLPGIFEYSDLGEPGEVVKADEIAAIGARTYRFSNNARLTVLRTNHEKEAVRALVRVGSGMLGFADGNPGVHALAMPTLFRSGFGDRPIEEVYSELRDNVGSFLFGIEDHDAFTYRAMTPASGLDEFLKIIAEYLLAPRISDEAFALAQMKLKQSRELEPDGMNEGYRELYRMLYPNEPRFHSPSLEEISRADAAGVRKWLEDPFKAGYLEVVVVGDIEEEHVVRLVSETLGALPARRMEKAEEREARAVKVSPQKGKRLIEYESGKGENAAAVVVWTVQDQLDLRESAALYLLATVLETRVREQVREEMGASYAPSVRYITFPAYDTLRHIRADVDCLERDASELLDVVLQIGVEMAREPVTLEELRAAVTPLEEGIRQAWRDNGFLLDNVLYGVHEYPDLVRNALEYRDGLLSTITPNEILQVGQRYLKSEEALAVAIVPAVDAKLAERPAWRTLLRAGARGE